jgi:hypothetical protein
MATNTHGNLSGQEVHVPYIQIFADESERLADADTYDAFDLYKKALQVDTVTEYILTSISPITWSALASGGAAVTENLIPLGMSSSFPFEMSSSATPGGTGNDIYNDYPEPITITFAAAPDDILIKRLKIDTYVAEGTNLAEREVYRNERSIHATVEEIRVNGTPINSAGMAMLGQYTTDSESPVALNLPLSSGDIVTMDITIREGSLGFVSLLYVAQPATLPDSNYFIGPAKGAQPFGHQTIPSAPGTYATGSIQVTASPVGLGETIDIWNRFTNQSFRITSVSGAPADDTEFQGDAGSINAIAVSLENAISTRWASEISTGGAPGGDTISLTADNINKMGNQLYIDNAVTGISILTNFSNGTSSATETITLEAAPANGTIKQIYLSAMQVTTNGESNRTEDGDLGEMYAISGLKIDGGANQLDSQLHGKIISPWTNEYNPDLNIAITSGQVITLEVESSFVSGPVIAFVTYSPS